MIVYKMTCTTSGKSYIGITACSQQRRWREHIRLALKGAKGAFPAAIRLYGHEAFTAEIIQTVATRQEACEAERRFIKEMNTLSPFGYNCTAGGDGGPTRTGRKHSNETKAKMRLASLGKKKSPEHIESMRKAFTGRKLSPEHAAKIRFNGLKSIGKKRTEEQLRKARIAKRLTAIKKGGCVIPNGNKWTVRVSMNGKRRYHGTYNTPEEAEAAYLIVCNEHLKELGHQ